MQNIIHCPKDRDQTEKKKDHYQCGDHPQTLRVTDALQEEKGKLEEEMAVLMEMTQNIVAENAVLRRTRKSTQNKAGTILGYGRVSFFSLRVEKFMNLCYNKLYYKCNICYCSKGESEC